MDGWLRAALDYIPPWLEFQVRMAKQPGCIVAVAHRDQILLERASGHANLAKNEKLTLLTSSERRLIPRALPPSALLNYTSKVGSGSMTPSLSMSANCVCGSRKLPSGSSSRIAPI
jgi:hypothetical protein